MQNGRVRQYQSLSILDFNPSIITQGYLERSRKINCNFDI